MVADVRESSVPSAASVATPIILAPATGSSLGLQTNLGLGLGVASLFGDLPSAYNQRWQGGIEVIPRSGLSIEGYETDTMRQQNGRWWIVQTRLDMFPAPAIP